MRAQLLKINKGHSTKAERKFAELCKKHRIKFRYKIKIQGYEVDFLIGRYAIEIAGHPQNVQKNRLLIAAGFTPFYLYNNAVSDSLGEWLKKL